MVKSNLKQLEGEARGLPVAADAGSFFKYHSHVSSIEEQQKRLDQIKAILHLSTAKIAEDDQNSH